MRWQEFHSMQGAVNKTIEEDVFSMWLTYIHSCVTDVFLVGSPRDNISGREPNQIKTRTRTRMQQVLGGQGRRILLKFDCVIVIHCDYE
jgi:hypothetical protein